MNTDKSNQLICKCQGILRMITRVESSIASMTKSLANYSQNPMYCASGERNLRIMIENKKFVADRLKRYYTRTLTRLTDEALVQCFPEPLSIAS